MLEEEVAHPTHKANEDAPTAIHRFKTASAEKCPNKTQQLFCCPGKLFILPIQNRTNFFKHSWSQMHREGKLASSCAAPDFESIC